MSHSRPAALRPVRPAALLTLAALMAALFTAIAPAGAAQAAAYRYWGYYHFDAGKWAFAQTGPDKFTPKDGAIEGWRFAVGDESSTRLPRATPTFEDICGATPAVAGKKRVGLVLDYGRTADAETGTPPTPTAKCAVTDPAATGAEVLAAVSSVRADKGLTCAIDSWPASGCGGEVKQVSAAARAADTPVTIAAAKKADAPASAKADSGTSTSTLVLIGVIVLAALAVAAVALRRRNRA